MADTDKTPEAPSAIEVGGASIPSQITINIGGASANGFVVHDITVHRVA